MAHSTHHAPHWRVLLTILIGVVTACGGGGEDEPVDDVRSGDTVVFQSRQAVLCGTRGITPAQGAQVLINGGIDVIKSGCGVMTGVAFPAVCGGDTGELLFHEIRKENLPDAERLGFESTATLKDAAAGTGAAWVDCETGMPLPN